MKKFVGGVKLTKMLALQSYNVVKRRKASSSVAGNAGQENREARLGAV